MGAGPGRSPRGDSRAVPAARCWRGSRFAGRGRPRTRVPRPWAGKRFPAASSPRKGAPRSAGAAFESPARARVGARPAPSRMPLGGAVARLPLFFFFSCFVFLLCWPLPRDVGVHLACFGKSGGCVPGGEEELIFSLLFSRRQKSGRRPGLRGRGGSSDPATLSLAVAGPGASKLPFVAMSFPAGGSPRSVRHTWTPKGL